jgi:hypothetical protein
MNTVIVRLLPGERRVSYSAAWFVPVDTVTGAPPSLPLTIVVDIRDGQAWAPTEIKPTVTLSGGIGYVDLGRCHDPGTTAPKRYRARFEPGAYLAMFRAYREGEEFLAFPFSDTTPPALAASPVTVNLAPAVSYPFSSDLPVIYGEVSTAAGEPVPDVLLSTTVRPLVLGAPRTMRTLTGPRGTFALPLRWVPPVPLRWAPAGQQITITAADYRHVPSRTGQLSVQLPDALGRNQTIVIR